MKRNLIDDHSRRSRQRQAIGIERLRENLVDLYGSVVYFEGPPSKTQVERTDAIAHELTDVMKDFDSWASDELGNVNTALTGKNLEPIKPIRRQEWEKK